MTGSVVLSHFQIASLVKARQQGLPVVKISPDLELTAVEVAVDSGGVIFPGGEKLTWDEVAEIRQSENSCFVLAQDGLHKIQAFSEITSRVYGLMPTPRAPTMLISGIPMHRIKGIDPHADTLTKIKAVKPVVGRVLDTATGLGYTAIEAAKTAESVTTIELDPVVLEICRQNPWSQALFDNPRIHQLIGDSVDVVETLEDGAYARIIHDPPTISLAGDLYSEAFYRQLYRLLARGGHLFHYIGDLDSNLGRRVSKGAIRRLQAVGFKRVLPRREAFGLLAYK